MKTFIKTKLKNARNKLNQNDEAITIIKPRSGWQIIDFKEMTRYRDRKINMRFTG